MGELEILERASQLFAGQPMPAAPDAGAAPRMPRPSSSATPAGYQQQVLTRAADIAAAADIDARVAALLRAARADHGQGRDATARIIAAAVGDQVMYPDSPVAQREALRRRIERLRAQHLVISRARRRARRRAALLRALRYRARRRGRPTHRLPAGPPGSRAEAAVRAAMSRLGRPYIWGATGPDSFDCSGLMQWSYRQAGINLDRTTYDQIHAGAPVPRSDIRPGDLVFPHTGHVQMAIGDGKVIEAPGNGGHVQIVPLGSVIAIRRPG